ncbi:transglycosylase domain-containing protein [Sphingomonas endolithica]|uniref:transglycosylase domain-containing protein n=1 Tax=Sphingomonas endolithica TaxID=2972485 RepID=UPI0021AFCCA3|nr:PBP1A family penicillin-binding protein [Sphingomonas sp. ZFBP2030]
MRPYPFSPATAPSTSGANVPPTDPHRPLDFGALPPRVPTPDPDEPDEYTTNLPVAYRGSRWRWLLRIAGVGVILFVLAVIWLVFTAPLSKSLEPLTPPSITLLASDGKPIARRGAIIGKPVDAAKLPGDVTNAFLAIEDRRFNSHWGVDPRGIARAFWHNVTSDGRNQGGSTITQQLAKNAFLDSDRTAGRKIREVLIAFWLEAWLSKNEILSRYLSNVYFGDNVYGLSAAAKHYFNRSPEDLSIAQSAMLAGLVKAPSKLAPTVNLSGARDRQKLVVAAMAAGGFITPAEAAEVRPARLATNRIKPLPDGTYFADWVLPEARDRAGEIAQETTVKTTLDRRLQTAAERVVRSAGLRDAQVALVAMRPDGRVVAMVGGKNYAASPFNRAVQAKRQPGSTFKLFVYLAALRSGLTPESMIEDEPVTIADWSPKNSDGRYAGNITLRRAFAKSSNVAAARLTQQVGVKNVIRAARDLGITAPIPNEATIALGSSSMSLLELTAAYAAVAAEAYPVRARGIEEAGERSWYKSLTDRSHPLSGTLREGMLDLLSASAETGTGRQAALSVKTYGKTGTTSDNRDALFVGFAGDLVVGVWVGNDDNTPNAGLSGGGIPARIWRDFMMRALGVGPAVAPEPEPAVVDPDAGNGFGIDDLGIDGVKLPEGEVEGLGLNLRVGPDGSIQVNRARDRERDEGRDDRRRDDRAPRDDEPAEDEF